ncbi:hypothetical protein [Lysinibacillus xylanilyticus]|uniref:hypothetical protein n=1 Tax=Lysinibacillus xylanilyticus TaxID=582475 RepID=UPI003D012646
MAFTKEILKDPTFDSETRKKASTCLMCHEEVTNGGTWGGVSDSFLLTICNDGNCIEQSIKWLIDAFISDETKDIRDLNTKQEFMNLVEAVYVNKANHPNHNK